ncbi:MAG: N-acetyltransferase O1 (Establishment of cohesion protein 1) [Cirrosporium novae-zelandiae]|nr:MAG: N-acetyltransferase O1 (Establishment of cohesion protein 1) [Cirrosporium novae-zelandiae]
MPYTVTSSFKRGLMMRTYSRPIQRVLGPDEDRLRKKQISQYREHQARESYRAPETTIRSNFRESSNVDASSPQPRSDTFSSDIPEVVANTPPSSPPPRSVSPRNAIRKHTFTTLKRKRSSGVALKEVNGNGSRKSGPSKKKQRLTQMQIDLGGETQRTCKTCGMEYVPSNAEDDELHKKYHSLNVEGVDVGKTFVNETVSRRIYLSKSRKASTLDAEGYIVVIDRGCPGMIKKKAENVLNVVNKELSAVDIDDTQLWSGVRPSNSSLDERNPKISTREKTEEDENSEQGRFKIFLHIKGNKCVGLCLAESIKQAYRVEENNGGGRRPSAHTRAKSSSISISKQAVPGIVGISRIWTSKSHRRQGIAEALLDSARSYFVYGMKVPKKMIAFSQPTESGCRLAENWFGAGNEWHVYAGS